MKRIHLASFASKPRTRPRAPALLHAGKTSAVRSENGQRPRERDAQERTGCARELAPCAMAWGVGPGLLFWFSFGCSFQRERGERGFRERVQRTRGSASSCEKNAFYLPRPPRGFPAQNFGRGVRVLCLRAVPDSAGHRRSTHARTHAHAHTQRSVAPRASLVGLAGRICAK